MTTPTAQSASQLITGRFAVCPRGHVYAEHAYVKPTGQRECYACRIYRRTPEYLGSRKKWVVLTDAKECRKCGVVKPITEFGASTLGILGRKSRCKDCARKSNLAWNRKNLEKKRASGRKCREKNPQRSMAICTASRSKRLGIACDAEYLATMPVPQACPVFGTPISFAFGKGKQPALNAASFDRIDPHRGYVRGNVQIMSRMANAMKQNATPEQMRQFAAWVMRLK